MSKSVEFEKLVAKIIAELEPTATVKWNDHILGNLSKRKRQIDVSIRRQDPEFLGILDAKDYTRAATIDRVDALAGVMGDVGAHYGALVCSSGFSKSIYDYARNRGISLFNAHDAQSLKWSLELTIPILWTELTPHVALMGTLDLKVGESLYSNHPAGLLATLDDGISFIDPMATFASLWADGKVNNQPGVLHHLKPEGAAKALIFDAAGNRQLRPLKDYAVAYVVESKTWLGRFQPDECRGMVDYLDGQAFTASHLPDSAIPMHRDHRWEPVENPEKLAVTMRGTAVICTQPVLVSGGRVEALDVQHLGPSLPEPLQAHGPGTAPGTPHAEGGDQ
ncbi:restriction endonuclease [Kitasatospora paranensis]|uniref:Restriction endonuclease n=1 Tax=Kitasatospora paranensis TaxID=258053 RepID=A0ABW2FU57_9ACTN